MTLAAFHTQVSNELKRGTTQAAMIPNWTKRAARWIERNYTFQYMKRFESFTLDPAQVEPRVLPLPETRLKQIHFIRFIAEAGVALESFAYLTKCDPRDVQEIQEAQPTRYWLDAFDYIWLDFSPTTALSGEIYFSRYTTWPTDTSESPWLVDNAEDVLLARTMLYAAPAVRMSEEMRTRYEAMLGDGLKTLVGAEQDLAEENRADVMNYGKVE